LWLTYHALSESKTYNILLIKVGLAGPDLGGLVPSFGPRCSATQI